MTYIRFRGAMYKEATENRDAAGFLFVSGNRMLLLRRDDGFWDLPGGGLETGEDPYSGAIREVTEELGAVPPHTITKEIEQPTPHGTLYTAFVASVTSEYMRMFHVNLDVEHDAASWFSPDELIFIEVHPGVLRLLNEVSL